MNTSDCTSKDIERFWSKVDKSDNHDHCWLWTDKPNPKGYGSIGVSGKTYRAHRVSYELAYGPIPDGLNVLHTCDNRICVNPNHLFIGTQLENIQDRDIKGRQTRGESHPRSKLTEDQVLAMRKRYIPFCRVNGANQIARELGVRICAVLDAVNKVTWKFLDQKGIENGNQESDQ